MAKRPSKNDSQNDILLQQAEFLKNKEKPSVKLVKTDDFAAKIINTPVDVLTCDDSQKFVNLIGDIVPKTTKNVVNMSGLTARGFPQARRRNIAEMGSGSLFSRQNKKQKPENIPDKSFIVTGEQGSSIHEENVGILGKMSQSEILVEKNKLLGTLDPKLVQFLQSKRQTTQNTREEESSNEQHTEPRENIQIVDTLTAHTENCLNFNEVQTEKLQWMQNIEPPTKTDVYEARFDFNGYLQPFSQEITEKNRVLFHHGEETGRPGYTLQELLKLSRSNVAQQRIISLNTISSILSLNSTGIYEKVLELPLEQIFFILRVSLDENAPNVLNASLKAMHNLFVHEIDETCLDYLVGFGLGYRQPVSTCEESLDKDLNDQQLAEVDLLKCLVRTRFLERVRYIINTIKPAAESVNCCLNLLIRILRDSDKHVALVLNTEDLLQSIIQYFVPKIYKLDASTNYCYNSPVVSAIKLLRIAISRSKSIAEELISRYAIMESLLSYLQPGIGTTVEGIKLQVETCRLITVLFKQNLCIQHYNELQPFILTSLDRHLETTDCAVVNLQAHCASVLSLVSNMSVLERFLVKLCAQIAGFSQFKCANLQMVSSVLVKLASCNTTNGEKHVSKLLFSAGFDRITQDVIACSNLLCEHVPFKTSDNLTSLRAAVWSNVDHIVPVLTSGSCMPFLVALSGFIANSSQGLILQFLQHANINKYLLAITNAKKLCLTSNWFSMLEAELIMNILMCAVKVQGSLNDLAKYFELTIKCLSIFNVTQASEIDYILKNIVFNTNFYPLDLNFKKMHLTELDLDITPILAEIYSIYSDILALKEKNVEIENNLSLNAKIGNIIPQDWIYAPILTLYTQFTDSKSEKMDENRQKNTAIHSLQWINLHEQVCPSMNMNQADKYCRLCCIFLCSNSLFLDKQVHTLLEVCLNTFIRKDNLSRLDFQGQVAGLTNFQDFYVQLLEHYQGVSYSDKVFANFIIVPLVQRLNSKWRKVFWSEYLAAAQAVVLEINECAVDINEFLTPTEEDLSLLKCYRRALVNGSLNRSPLLKFIANYHVENFVKRKRDMV